MIKVGLVGVGRMGSYHLEMYERLAENRGDIKLVAICDTEPDRTAGKTRKMFNMGGGSQSRTMDDYAKYTDIDEMLEKEDLDMVDVVCPTYLHSEFAVKVLNSGRHCMCEKPMARNFEECDAMIEAAKRSGKNLMIGQCLRFWREYVYLHDTVKYNRFGRLKGLSLWRGGFADHEKNPSWHDWIINAEKGGGGLFDQHIHDTDFILWTLGNPKRVCTFASKFFPESRDDIVMSNYVYDNIIVSAQDDIAYRDLPFGFGYVADFETATVEFKDKLTVYPHYADVFSPDLSEYGISEDAYYNELYYFLDCIKENRKPERCTPESARETVKLALLEAKSAEENRK